MPTTKPQSAAGTLRYLLECEDRVFPTYPQVSRYFPSSSSEGARQRLGRAIERGDGPGMVIGGPGTGKSLLLQVLAAQFHDQFDIVLPACARLCTRRALVQAILFELGLPYKQRDEGDLRLSLLDHLLSREECPSGLLLLVDEAQTLPAALLDELRVLTNLVRGGQPRVRLVLAGSSALEETFAHSELESFSQRLAARCYLGPFRREETNQFVRAQVAASGASADELFTRDSWDALFEATDGVPRLINQVCDLAVAKAVGANREKVDRAAIQAAWAELQQLPAPWETPAPTTAPPAPLQVVEFGELSEESQADYPPSSAVHLTPSRAAVAPASFDQQDDEYLLDIDDTELDVAETSVSIAAGESAATIPDGAPAVERPGTPAVFEWAGSPFEETFHEEEVVLDAFSRWDDMFRRGAPRVENRRNPEFAALVAAAMNHGGRDIDETTPSPQAVATMAALDRSDVHGQPGMAPSSSELENCQCHEERPSLRLAVVADSASEMIATGDSEQPAFSQSTGESDWNEATNWDATPSSTWSTLESIAHDEVLVEEPRFDDSPILIIEEDVSTPPAPVRREEYRNLFSRLRSG